LRTSQRSFRLVVFCNFSARQARAQRACLPGRLPNAEASHRSPDSPHCHFPPEWYE